VLVEPRFGCLRGLLGRTIDFLLQPFGNSADSFSAAANSSSCALRAASRSAISSPAPPAFPGSSSRAALLLSYLSWAFFRSRSSCIRIRRSPLASLLESFFLFFPQLLALPGLVLPGGGAALRPPFPLLFLLFIVQQELVERRFATSIWCNRSNSAFSMRPLLDRRELPHLFPRLSDTPPMARDFQAESVIFLNHGLTVIPPTSESTCASRREPVARFWIAILSLRGRRSGSASSPLQILLGALGARYGLCRFGGHSNVFRVSLILQFRTGNHRGG